MNNQEALILLNMVKGLGSVKIKRLIEAFPKPQDIFTASANALKQVDGLGELIVQRIIAALKENDLEKELSLIEKHKVKVISFLDKEYPDNLKEIFDPPIILYLRGEIKPEDVFSLAMVGARQPSIYGLRSAEKLSRELAGLGVTIVSGLARGIDANAHRGALKARGRTLAVLGNGLSSIYPRENKLLAQEIIERGGAVISEFPMDTPAHDYNFPRRNRIISGLSLGVVVVEATSKSGALITANFALEQGREVFAVPGNIDSLNSEGPNALIKQGAKLVKSTEDIIEELESIGKNYQKGLKLDKQGFKKEEPMIKLNPQEQEIYQLLNQEPAHVDEITSQSGLAFNRVSSILINLEIKKAVKQLPGKLFIRN